MYTIFSSIWLKHLISCLGIQDMGFKSLSVCRDMSFTTSIHFLLQIVHAQGSALDFSFKRKYIYLFIFFLDWVCFVLQYWQQLLWRVNILFYKKKISISFGHILHFKLFQNLWNDLLEEKNQDTLSYYIRGYMKITWGSFKTCKQIFFKISNFK